MDYSIYESGNLKEPANKKEKHQKKELRRVRR
jgi:hypothetical protein